MSVGSSVVPSVVPSVVDGSTVVPAVVPGSLASLVSSVSLEPVVVASEMPGSVVDAVDADDDWVALSVASSPHATRTRESVRRRQGFDMDDA